MAAKTIDWRPGLTLPHDPNEIEDYEFDAANLVGDGDALSSVSVEVSDITAVRQSFTAGGLVIVRVSGGTVGTTGSVTLRLGMTSGRSKDRTIQFKVTQR